MLPIVTSMFVCCRCGQHAEKLSVYCWTCCVVMCHRCALWGGAHCGHSLRPLEEVYQCYATQLRDEVSQLRRRLSELVALVQEVVSAGAEAVAPHCLLVVSVQPSGKLLSIVLYVTDQISVFFVGASI